MIRRIRALAAEPLVHFLLIGAALFGVYRVTGNAAAGPQDRIVIGAGAVDRLALTFSRVYMRPPTAEELRGLIEKEIREEVYAREAMAMGLDRNDEIIRRRLQQKLEFLSEDVAARRQPTEAELREYLARHPDRFRTDTVFNFRQVYVGGNRSKGASDRSRDLLSHLRSAGPGADIGALGDRLSLPSEYASAASSDVARDFGASFAARIAELQIGSWEGPVESGYGRHLVLVTSRVPGVLPAFDRVRAAVEREWQAEQRGRVNEKFYEALRAKYAITVEVPAWARSGAPTANEARVR
jgi:hypothetical protein